MADEAKLETINHFFRVHAVSTNRCHEPEEKCERATIRAHSIPSGTILTSLADDGHVIMPHMKLKLPPPAEISFRRVGKNQATTFAGLCSQHDSEIFRPIDARLPNVEDPAHLFLLAYRAVLREFHVCLQNACRFQSTYQRRVELGLSPGSEPCDFGMFATAHVINAYEFYEYKRQFDQYYLTCNWSEMHHHVIILTNQAPSIAVSSVFSLDDVDAPQTPRATLSVFPTGDDRVMVVFSAIPSDSSFVATYLDRILSSDGSFQKYLLSKLILQACDNFVIAPKYFDALDPDRKSAMCQFFVDTIQHNAEEHEDEHLYLF